MCYSALVKSNLRSIAAQFHARIDVESFEHLFEARLKNPELKVPFGLDRYFMLSPDPAEKRLASLVEKFHHEESERVRQEISAAEDEMKTLASGKPTATNKKKIEVRGRRIEKLRGKQHVSFDRITPLDERIFPGYFAPVIVARGDHRALVPMRYRVRLPDGSEVPSKYNVFNARRDSLLRAPTWRPLFGRSHALFPFVKFFEWVEREGKKREIAFTPENRALMWAACLYSAPKGKGALDYPSFAMVTDEPPPEVSAAGHDRCPVFLESEAVEAWLHPEKSSPETLLALLDRKEKAFYLSNLVA